MIKEHEFYQYVNSISKGIFSLFFSFYIVHDITDLDQRAIAFSFLSISGVSIIFDLGLSQIFIKWVSTGDNIKIARNSIFSWYFLSALLSALVGLLLGFYFFDQFNYEIWLYPFLALIASLFLNILFSGYALSLEADGKIVESYKVKMLSSLLLLFGGGLSYFFSLKLYFLAVAFGISSFWFIFKKDIFFIRLTSLKTFLLANKLFIRQSSLVWMSGFLFWNAPILISTKLYPSSIASTFALTFNILVSLNFFSLSIFSSNRAVFSKLISNGLISEALNLLKGKFFQIISIFIFGQLILVLFILLKFDFAIKYTKIFFSMEQYFILTALLCCLLILQIIAVFMRSAGKESFYKELVVINFLTPIVFCLGLFDFKINIVLIIWMLIILLITIFCLFKFKSLINNLKLKIE
jgi:hypothetical protein